MTVLSVQDLTVEYRTADGQLPAVDDVSFDVDAGEIVGLLGESGCGKTTLAQSIVRNLPSNASIPSGTIELNDEEITGVSEDRLRELRWEHVAYIPQNAMNALDPIVSIKEQLVEPVVVHRDVSKAEAVERAREVLDVVGIDPSRIDAYPHELSGGMKQRVIVAMALVLEPDLIIADEPTTGLDVLVRDRILNDFERYRDEFDISIIMVSHDIADLVETSDVLLVMYGGKIVETGPSRSLFDRATHPYTIGLRNSLPNIGTELEDLISMEMEPPDLLDPPAGCRFVNRCPFAVDECHEAHPDYRTPREGIASACYRADEAAEMRERAQQVDWRREELAEGAD
jgi:oligopeptide/dipeptide ABC transporter ATP-binding protein